MLVPRNQSIGLNREISYQAYIDNPDNSDVPFSITWKCNQVAEGVGCRHFMPTKIPIQTLAFSQKGFYKISVDVMLNGISKSDTAFIEVHPEIIVSVEIPQFSAFDVVGGAAVSIPVFVHHLIPQCYAEWMSVQGIEGFAWLDTESTGINLGNLTVNDIEENFLSELIEYENNTVTHELVLEIPGRMGNYTGLIENKMYLFSLFVTCPVPIEEDYDGIRDNVTSYLDLVLEVNQPPSLEPLEISPKSGEALHTLFKFSTGPALDSPSDYPMRYSFYYNVDGLLVQVNEFYENTVTSTEFPYSESPIKTFYKVCDSRNACDEIPGPSIDVTLNENITETELNFVISSLQGSMFRKDYQEMFRVGINALITFSKFSDNRSFGILKTEMDTLITDEISDLKTSQHGQFISQSALIDFVRYSKIMLEKTGRNDLYKDLVSILDLSRERTGREKRSPIVTNHKPSYEKYDLQLELLVKDSESNASGTHNLLTSPEIQTISYDICSNLGTYGSYKFSKSPTLSLEIIRGNWNNLRNRNFTISHGKSKFRAHFIILGLNEGSDICVIKAVLSQSEVSLFQVNLVDPVDSLRDFNSGFDKILISMPLSDELRSGNVSCFLNEKSRWTDDVCTTLYLFPESIYCSCTKIGIFKVMESVVRPSRNSENDSTTTGIIVEATTNIGIKNTSPFTFESVTAKKPGETTTKQTDTNKSDILISGTSTEGLDGEFRT